MEKEKRIKIIWNTFKTNKEVSQRLEGSTCNKFEVSFMVDLYCKKYIELQKINSLLAFHRPAQVLKDMCTITKADYEYYAKQISQDDSILAVSYTHLTLPTIYSV